VPTDVIKGSSCPGGCQDLGLAKASQSCEDESLAAAVKVWISDLRQAGSPSLDKNLSSSGVERESTRGSCWNRQQKRGYNRALSCLQYWQSNGYQVLWVMLSTADGGDKRLLSKHHDSLIRRVERRGFPGIQHFQVRTSEGNGVLHVLWAWRSDDGMRQKSFYVGQRWLSESWRELHGAPVVWISRVGAHRRDMFRVARYCIAQYVSGQAGYEYMSYSWKRAFGFPLVACWLKMKSLARSYSELINTWSRFLAGEIVWCEYGGFTMGSIRLGYSEYGREFWNMLHWR
jgi:hypothetical protein